MPDIQAFRAIRYDLGHVGSLSDVVAPPYDVIGPELQSRLYKQHPANVVRLILNRQEPGDDEAASRYGRAARFLKNWLDEGILFRESGPAVYVYHQEFQHGGRQLVRRGFMCRVRLERFGEGRIYPHEETMSGPKQDRLRLTQACRANLSQVFGLYPDPQSRLQELLESAIADQAPIQATDHLGVVHRMWPVTDVGLIAKLQAAMGPKPVYIADGHHRYETACNYRDQLAQQHGGQLDPHHPANFVLMMCVGMDDPGMIVLPTHRLLQGVAELTAAELVERLGDAASTRIAGEGADMADVVWDEIEAEDEQGTFGLFTAKDERWVVARVTEAGRRRMAELAPEHSPHWRELGVALLHRLILADRLGWADLPTPKYVHLVEEVVENLETGGFSLAALVMPATLELIEAISGHGERMPAKSTYFYPKLLSGLVINPLE
jgi:uncharacterized protein (DUF1015 family)